MDPQAAITRIIQLIGSYPDDDCDEFNELFENLHEWLLGGGFAPVVTFKMVKRSIVICRPFIPVVYHLQVVTDGNGVVSKKGEFEFAVYSAINGDLIQSWPMKFA